MNECRSKKKDRRATASSKFDQDVLLGGRVSRGALPVPATADQTNNTKAEGEDIGSRL
jgi:hypothetical protein